MERVSIVISGRWHRSVLLTSVIVLTLEFVCPSSAATFDGSGQLLRREDNLPRQPVNPRVAHAPKPAPAQARKSPVKLVPVIYHGYCGYNPGALGSTPLITTAAPTALSNWAQAPLACPRAPSAVMTQDWRCTAGSKFCDDFRASDFVSRGQLGAAAAPHGYTGDRAHLRSRLQDAWDARQLSIFVFGNSVTCGAGCDSPWPARVVELLERTNLFGVPNQIELHLSAVGGATSQWALAHIGQLVDILSRSHIVLVDLSMGDNVDFDVTYKDITSTTKALVSILRSISTPPAIIYLETFSFDIWNRVRQQKPWCSTTHTSSEVFVAVNGTQATDPCNLDVRCFPHWQALHEMGVPMISYFDAVCAALPRSSQLTANKEMSFWRPGIGQQGPQHPTCDTHEVIAHLLAAFLHQGFREVCEANPRQPRRQQELAKPFPTANPWNVSNACLLRPTTIYESLPIDMFSSYTARSSSDASSAPKMAGPMHFPSTVESTSWVYAEDKRGKPGWISQVNKRGAIRFKVETIIGEVILEYLSTYSADIGTATCQVGAGPVVNISGRITERISVGAFIRIQAVPAQGMHDLICRSDGKKFKLLSLRAC